MTLRLSFSITERKGTVLFFLLNLSQRLLENVKNSYRPIETLEFLFRSFLISQLHVCVECSSRVPEAEKGIFGDVSES
jgi:hypothetical protein